MTNTQHYRLIVGVYACATVDKYIHQLRTVQQTWGRLCNVNESTVSDDIPNRVIDLVRGKVKLLFFIGEHYSGTEFVGDEFIRLPNVNDDYLSASYKQYMGLKHIYENFTFDFTVCCGTDTFLNIPKMLTFLCDYMPTDNLYIGGHGCHRMLYGTKYYFHSGGPGFVLTRECLSKLYPKLIRSDVVGDWLNICHESNALELNGACDVSISYYLQQPEINVTIVSFNDLSFRHCNYRGFPCHQLQPDLSKTIACHLMSKEDSNAFMNILINNDFFVYFS
jgi:hypothetical protein